MEALAAHNLTLRRIAPTSTPPGTRCRSPRAIDCNLAIARRYVDAIVDDIKAFLGEVADAVIAKVRAVVAAVAEPLLQKARASRRTGTSPRRSCHHDPLTGEDVPRTTVEILTDFLRSSASRRCSTQMTERGTLQKTADWVDTQIGQFTGLVGQVARAVQQARGRASARRTCRTCSDTLPRWPTRRSRSSSRSATSRRTSSRKVLELVKEVAARVARDVRARRSPASSC